MEIIDFINNYWQFISTGIVIIITIVLAILKRNKFNVTLPSNTMSQLIDLIKSAETIYGSGHGASKLNFVVESYMKKNEIKFFDTEVRYFISGLVERILSTPEKKGKSDEEVK